MCLTSCKPKELLNTEVQSTSGGLAAHIYYRCTTATQVNAQKIIYKTSFFNNTSREISLQIAESSSAPPVFRDLQKSKQNLWVDAQRIRLELTQKKDGHKGIRVSDAANGRTVDIENSHCSLMCTGPTILQDGRCMWSGVTEEDPYGNFVIDVLSGAGTSAVFRMLAARAGTTGVVLASDHALRTGAELIAKIKTYDDAVAQTARAIEKTNPLSGTSLVGKGNCANDAATQIVSLVLGRWACAIPYPKGQVGYAHATRIADDLGQMIGIRSTHTKITQLSTFADDVLRGELPEGGIALIFSGSKNAGHVTLITKLKGQLVHINNQQWPERFQSIAQWEKTWRSTYGRNGAVFNVFVMTKRIIGFN